MSPKYRILLWPMIGSLICDEGLYVNNRINFHITLFSKCQCFFLFSLKKIGFLSLWKKHGCFLMFPPSIKAPFTIGAMNYFMGHENLIGPLSYFSIQFGRWFIKNGHNRQGTFMKLNEYDKTKMQCFFCWVLKTIICSQKFLSKFICLFGD